MASISSLMSSGSSGSIYGSRSANMISGLASGMDTEAMIEGMVMGYKQKIIGLQQDRTILTWQQEKYQSISDQLVEFSRKYTSYTSPTNLMSTGFFNNSVITSTSGKYKDLVTASGKSSSDIVLNAVAQLATSARQMSSASGIDGHITTGENGAHTITGGQVDMNDPQVLSKMSGSLTVTYGTQKITLEFDELEDFSKADGTLDTQKFEQALKDKLEDVRVSTPSGDTVPATDKIDVKVGEDGKVTFSDKSSDGNSVYISSASGDFKEMVSDYDNAVEEESSSFQMNMGAQVVDKSTTKAQYLSEKSFVIDFNGQKKTIKLGKIELKSEDSGDWNKAIEREMNKAIQDSIGSSVSVKYNPGSTGADGSFSFEVKPGNTFSIQSEYGDVLFGDGTDRLASYVDTSKKLDELGRFDTGVLFLNGKIIHGKRMEKVDKADWVQQSDGSYTDAAGNKLDSEGYPVDEDGEYLYEFSFSINGKEVKFTQDATINQIMTTINDNPEMDVNISFSKLSNSFVLTSKETGSASKIEIGGELGEALFGNVAEGDYQKGQDAIFQATINGKTSTFVRSSNSVEIDGMTINFEGTFNVKEGTKYPIDGENIPDDIFVDGEDVTFSSKTDTDKILEAIKTMVEDYNKMVTDVKNAFSEMPLKKADGSKGGARYRPLTDEDKEGMTESEIKAYEEKAKTGILFMDRDLSNLYSDLRGAIASSPDASYLRSIGIETSYEDGLTTIKLDEAKLKEALEKDLDGVRDVFTKSKETGATEDGLMASLKKVTDRYAATTGATKGILIEKAGSKYAPTAAMDNDMLDKMNEIDKQIASWQEKMGDKVDYYTHKFTQLEMLINQMNSQGAALAGMASGGGGM